ncbi:MAG: hypothetical protein AAF577_11770 [Pseudomonadota bacterium]
MTFRPNTAPSDPIWLLRTLAIGLGDGIAAGWTVLLIAVEMDVNGIGTLVKSSDGGTFAFFIMTILTAITFGLLGIAWRVMVILPDE